MNAPPMDDEKMGRSFCVSKTASALPLCWPSTCRAAFALLKPSFWNKPTRRKWMIQNLKAISWIFLCVLLFSFASSAQLPDFIKRLSGGNVGNTDFKTEIPFTYIDERICVKSKINNSDKEYTFILDTYSPCMVRESLVKSIPLDTLDLTEQMGKQLEGSMMKPLFPKFETISLGDVVFKDIGAIVMREDEKNPFLQVLEDGLIGANLLKCCVWQFNFQDMKIVVTDKKDRLDHLMNAARLPFNPISVQQSPNIRITLNDEDSIDVQFDTGSKGFLTFSSPSLLALVDSGDAVALHRRSISPIESPESDIETYHLALLKSLKLGEKTFHDLPVGVYRKQNEKETAQGNIGIEFMKHFIVTIDWSENQLYLAPIKGLEMKHNMRTFGMTYGYFDGAVRVASLYAGSEAEQHGIKIGDPVIEINGHRVDDLSKDQIREFLHCRLRFSNDTDERLSLIVLTGGTEKRVDLLSYTLF